MADRSFARTLAVSLGGAGFGALGAFAVAVLIGRSLGPAGTGLYFQAVAAFTITATTLKLGADTGLVRAMSQLVAQHKTSDVRRVLEIALGPVLAVSATIAVVALLISPILAEQLVRDESMATDATMIARVLSVLAPVSALFVVTLGAARGLGSVVGYVFLLNLALPTARIVLVAVVLSLGLGAAWAVLAWAGSLPLWLLLAAVLVRSRYRRVRQRDVDLSVEQAALPVSVSVTPRSFWTFSAGRWAAASVEILLDWMDVILVGILTSPAVAGLYAIATRVVRAGQVVDNAMRVAVGPRISGSLAINDKSAVRTLIGQASQTMLVLTLPFYITCLIFAETILEFFGPEFADAGPALRILAVGMIISASTIMLQSVVLMGGRSIWQFRNKSIQLTIVIVGNLALVPVLGLVGAATAWVLGVLVDSSLVYFQSRRLVGDYGPRRQVVTLLVVGGAIAGIGVLILLFLGQTTFGLVGHVSAIGLAYLVGLVVATKYLGFSPLQMLRR